MESSSNAPSKDWLNKPEPRKDDPYWQMQSPLFRLPQELLNQVYMQLLVSAGPIELWPRLFAVNWFEYSKADSWEKRWMRDVGREYSLNEIHRLQ